VPVKRILGLAIAFMLLIGMAGIGTWAYFSDVETSTGNTMAAGTLDLKTDDVDGVTGTITLANMKPGDSTSGNITLKNSGSVDGATLDIVFSYGESDGSPNVVDMDADDTAAMIEVTTLDYDSSSLLGGISDGNDNFYTDIEDLKNATTLTDLSGITASATKDFDIAVQLRTETGNDFQADGINITMTFTLNQ
jgi:spore coat-associated protein N